MRKRIVGVCLLLLIGLGCSPKLGSSAQSEPAEKIKGRGAPPQNSHIQVQIEPLGQVANNGLQLPVVSPDGKWIAYLDWQSSQPIEPPEALLRGRPLTAMSLYVRAVGSGNEARMVCASSAAWPAWSKDSKKLVFVACSEAGRCDLVIYDLDKLTSRRLTLTAKQIMMPAFSGSGKQLAVVFFEAQSDSYSLHVINLETGNIEESCPVGQMNTWQLWPQWTADGRIVFLASCEGRTWLAQWAPGRFSPQRLAEIHISTSRAGIYQAMAGLARPLSSDGRYFAYYKAEDDRIVLLGLDNGKEVKLPAGVRAGCWLGRQRFAGADEREVRLFDLSGGVGTRLMRGMWLPRIGESRSGELILCTRGQNRRVLSLVRMRVLSDHEAGRKSPFLWWYFSNPPSLIPSP